MEQKPQEITDRQIYETSLEVQEQQDYLVDVIMTWIEKELKENKGSEA